LRLLNPLDGIIRSQYDTNYIMSSADLFRFYDDVVNDLLRYAEYGDTILTGVDCVQQGANEHSIALSHESVSSTTRHSFAALSLLSLDGDVFS
jgi:hypothetical protein